MKMGLVTAGLVVAGVVACSSAAQTKAASKLSGANAEAEREAAAHWQTLLIKCGSADDDSHFGRVRHPLGDYYMQFKGLSFTIVPDTQITEADRLNGKEWGGWAKGTAKAVRDGKAGGWRLWGEGTSFGFRLEKEKGVWRFTRFERLPDLMEFLDVAKPTCTEIPSL